TFMISDLTGRITDPVIRKRITRVATTMIPKAIGRGRARLDWKSMNSAVAPPTSTVARGGAARSRIRFTVSLLAPELDGVSEIARITVTPSPSCCGGGAARHPPVVALL